MQRLPTYWVLLLLTATALSGCAGKDKDDHGGEEDAATLAGTGYDQVIGNAGFRITGSLTGAAAALGEGSAVEIDALDTVPDDSQGANDKATLILDAKETGFNVLGGLRSMATKTEANGTGDHFGGVGRNVKVFGATGVGPSGLPEVTAYLFVAGFANIKLGDKVQSNLLVFIAVVPGLRDHNSQAALTAPDAGNAQVHVIFPGSTVPGKADVAGVPDGFLYYYFEAVGTAKLDDAKKADIGKTLVEPETANTPPVAAGSIMVDGKVATSATMEQDVAGVNKNVTVTFDGTASKDPDGVVNRWVWRIGELTANSTYEKPKEGPSVVQGETANFTFTQPGAKLIELTVSDRQGGSASINLNFYVNFHRMQDGGSGSFHFQSAGGGNSCNESVNCFKHTSTIEPAAVSAVYKAVAAGATINGFHIDLYAPGKATVGTDTPVKTVTGATLTVSAADLKVAGRYTVVVWWTSAASAGGRDNNPQTLEGIYTLESTLTYSPSVAA